MNLTNFQAKCAEKIDAALGGEKSNLFTCIEIATLMTASSTYLATQLFGIIKDIKQPLKYKQEIEDCLVTIVFMLGCLCSVLGFSLIQIFEKASRLTKDDIKI